MATTAPTDAVRAPPDGAIRAPPDGAIRVPDYPPPVPSQKRGTGGIKWIVGIVVVAALLGVLALIGSSGGSSSSKDASTPAVSANQVEQSMLAIRSRKAANVGGGTTAVAIDSESCQILNPGTALCAERFTISSVYGGSQTQSQSWHVSYKPSSGDILAYTH